MKNQKKVQTKIEVPGIDGIPFKLRLTNSRTKAYPKPPEEADYSKFRVGDYICKHNNSTTIYEVVDIYRVPISDQQIELCKNYHIVNNKEVLRLLAEYKKNGNFGLCEIVAKPILRGSKALVKSRCVIFSDIAMGWRREYYKVDLNNLLNTKRHRLHKLDFRLTNLYNKRKSESDRIDALANLINSTKVPNTIEIYDQIGKVVAYIKDKQLV